MVHPPGSFKSPGPPDGRQARLQAGPRAGLAHFSMRNNYSNAMHQLQMNMVHRPVFKNPGPPDSRRAHPRAGPRAGPTHFSMRKDHLKTSGTRNTMHQTW